MLENLFYLSDENYLGQVLNWNCIWVSKLILKFIWNYFEIILSGLGFTHFYILLKAFFNIWKLMSRDSKKILSSRSYTLVTGVIIIKEHKISYTCQTAWRRHLIKLNLE